MSKGDDKACYFDKLKTLFKSYGRVIVIGVDNVTSNQMHQLRTLLRGRAVMLMGRNTMIRKGISMALDEMPSIEALIPHIRGNVGLVFTNEDPKAIKDVILSNKVPAPARVGCIAQCEVIVNAGNTGMPPDKTSFFQALNISTRVMKGAIEIVNDVVVLKKGDKVGCSEAELLSLLKITPFMYGCVVEKVYEDGNVYSASILDMTKDDIIQMYRSCISNIAGVSMSLGYITLPSVPYILLDAYRNILKASIGSEYIFEGSKAVQDAIENPVAIEQQAASGTAPTNASPGNNAEDSDEDGSDEEMGLDLFG